MNSLCLICLKLKKTNKNYTDNDNYNYCQCHVKETNYSTIYQHKLLTNQINRLQDQLKQFEEKNTALQSIKSPIIKSPIIKSPVKPLSIINKENSLDVFLSQYPINLEKLTNNLKSISYDEYQLKEININHCPNKQCNHLNFEQDPIKIVVPEFDNIDSIEKIIAIAETYHCQKNYNYNGIDMKKMYLLIEPLKELQSMVGLTNCKTKIIEQILYFVKGFHNGEYKDMMHTVITGSPGTGKTTFARIIGKIYSTLGLVSKGHFVEVGREDLIGKFLGHTAEQTSKTIEKCLGGIMFIDEVYSLGHSDKRDSFSKECIDILNQKLSENRDMLCIIAGYHEDIETCFFNQNKGLKRRFPFVYDIEGYSNKEMSQIFQQKMHRDGWEIDSLLIKDYIHKFDKKIFKYYGGDIETFVLKTKIVFAQTHFYQTNKIIDKDTLSRAFKLFEDNRKEDENLYHLSMYN